MNAEEKKLIADLLASVEELKWALIDGSPLSDQESVLQRAEAIIAKTKDKMKSV